MNRFLLVTLLFGIPFTAAAQTTSDLMPALPAAPSGTSGVYYPGMPLPPSPKGAGGGERTGSVSRQGAPEENPGRKSYEIYDVPTLGGGDPSSHFEADKVPDTHVVRKGDTLWDISGLYFHNPWTWPKLWALNPSITNPHWIYPGDVLRLLKEGAAAAVPVSTLPNRPHAPTRADGIFLRENGFIEPDELKNASTLIGSKEEKLLLSSLDEAYVEMKPDHPLRVGERYTIYRPIKEVKHPVTGKKVGIVVQILAEAEVKTITDGKMARIKIIDATDPIERGDRCGPLRRQFKIVEPVANAEERDGVVLTQLRPLNLVAADQIAFVDLGKQEGIVVGNRLLITRRGDGRKAVLGTRPTDDRRYPREIVGEVLVVETREHMSTGLVTKSYIDAHFGDRVEARKGY